jgi:hypothetical protein
MSIWLAFGLQKIGQKILLRSLPEAKILQIFWPPAQEQVQVLHQV